MVILQATLVASCFFAPSVAEDIGDSSCALPRAEPQQESVLLQKRHAILHSKLELNASLPLAQSDVECRFASRAWDGLIDNTDVQDEYVKAVLKWDGKFATEGAGITAAAVTQDHISLDDDGEIRAVNGRGMYTAPSKENLHLSMLALVLDETPLAFHWLSDTQEEAETEALRRLGLIIAAYESWRETCPACGGFLPWVPVNDDGFGSVKKYKMPALDNGQMAWGMVSVLQALEDAKQRRPQDEADLTDLQSRYQAHVDKMKGHVSTIFQNPKGKVSTMAKAKDPKADIDPSDYKQKGSLQDPFEGELMLMFIDLISDGDERPTDTQIAKMWKKYNKGNNAGTWTSEETGPITIQKGWRFSAHEAWKYLVLPYLDEEFDTVRRLFKNQERVRTWEAHNSGIPGLKAACYGTNPWYVDRLGIVAASSGFDDQVRESDKMVTPYGAFPLILIDRGQGLAWHRAMLARPRMQNQYGSTEASRQNSDNPQVAMKCTWDTKVTTDVALAGGTHALLKRYLQANGKWDRFVERVTLNHQKYESLEGEDVDFAPPPEQEVTNGAQDFSTCEDHV